MFGLSFQIWGTFLNIAKDSICTCFHHLFNNCLDFTISSLLIHGPKSKILYTDLFFFTFIVNCEKYIPEEFFLCSHLYIVRACLAVPLCLNGCYIMVLEFGCCVPESGENNLVLLKDNFGKEFVRFISHCERKWSVV